MKVIQDEFTGTGTNSTRYYYRNKDKINQNRYKHKFNNVSYWLWKSAKARAAKKNIDFSIGVEDIIVPENCPVFDLKLLASNSSAQDSSPSLDRIDNTKGYVKGNIQVISNKANRLKGDATLEEIERLYNWLRML